jgi:uncharacterized cupredoxin-like copper-binding protein
VSNHYVGKEINMKTLILLAALLIAVTVGSSASVASKTTAAGKKRAVMQFIEPVKLMGVTLKGEYLFVHDDEAMARGETCTFVYKGNAPIDSKLVVSFHCLPVQRARVGSFTVRMVDVAGVTQVREYQFEGETETHLVPDAK